MEGRTLSDDNDGQLYDEKRELNTDRSEILSALGGDGIGEVAEDLLKTKIPQEKDS